MYNAPQIQQAFFGMVGFFQPDDPAYMTIDPALTASSSGKYVQTTHPLATLENIQNIAPEFNGFSYAPWVAVSVYTKGAIVSYNNEVYECIEDAPVNTPPTDAYYWEKIAPYSRWLKRLYDGAVNALVNDLVTYKALTNAGKSLLDSQQLYNGFGGYNDRIIKRGRFVGLEIAVARAEQIGVMLNRIGFQCDGAVTINYYLYHSSRVKPITLIPVNVDGGGDFQWTKVSNVIMGYLSENYDSTGLFYLGYYEDDLPADVQAISRRMDFRSPPCGTCGTYNIKAFNAWSRYVKIGAVEVPAEYIDPSRNMFDPAQIRVAGDTNYGINMDLSVGCDVTSFFILHKNQFADGLAARIVVNILNGIAFNTRIGAISDRVKKLAMAELDPNPKSGSFLSQYHSQLKALNINFSGFNESCLPVFDNNTRIKFKTI